MFRRKRTFSLLRRQDGQMTVFFGIVLVIIVTIIAFVVNVGLYVKAKINLQNAVDAAAWSGAAVQARQLTSIAHLNWEMRNTYKELMFKYYVLGMLSQGMVRDNARNIGTKISSRSPAPQGMDFTMQHSATYDGDAQQDPVNVPSICIDFSSGGGTTGHYNLCNLAQVPGLPRFQNTGVGSSDDLSNNIQDALALNKAKDCATRSLINYGVARAWLYGVPDLLNDGRITGIPQIAMNRVGALPKALELGIRIRNLELIMNHHDISPTFCLQGNCSITYSKLETEKRTDPRYERPYKAFMSAFRNLGSQEINGSSDLEFMKQNFVLEELTPQAKVVANPTGLTGFLGNEQSEKPYVNLHVEPVNFALFFTAFASGTSSSPINGNTPQEAACFSSKVAIPLPLYPLGFEKAPDTLTYYAVKGTTRFVGLFNPFETGGDGTEIVAFAAAKPFGARIGPRLFDTLSDPTRLNLRGGASGQSLSYSYAAAFDTTGSTIFKAGDPIPLGATSEFWHTGVEGLTIGSIDGAENIRFAIPNMIYDFDSSFSDQVALSNLYAIMFVDANDPTGASSAPYIAGLYSPGQFAKFSQNLRDDAATVLSGSIDETIINNAMKRIKSPTAYEAANFTIPLAAPLGGGIPFATPPMANDLGDADAPPGYTRKEFQIYAPLFCPECHYKTLDDVITFMQQKYQSYLDAPMQKFLDALKSVAKTIYGSEVGGNSFAGAEINRPASNIMYDGYIEGRDVDEAKGLTCESIAGRLYYYIMGINDTGNSVKPVTGHNWGSVPCGTGAVPFLPALRAFWEGGGFVGDPTAFGTEYKDEFYVKNTLPSELYAAAYSPRKREGVGSGMETRPLPDGNSDDHLAYRSAYSVKFLSIDDLIKMGGPKSPYGYMMLEDQLTQESISGEAGNVLDSTLVH